MCGIYGYIGTDADAASVVVSGLQKLEYRGYDSAGLAIIDANHNLKILKQVGYVSELNRLVFKKSKELIAKVGIGHTRWATHGRVNKANTHPHIDCHKQIAVVHNGVIENYRQLQRQLIEKGHRFTSQTDTEVIPHLIEEFLAEGLKFRQAFNQALSRLVGAWAVAVISELDLDTIWIGRHSSPLAVGIGDSQLYLSSDARAFDHQVGNIVFLEDGHLGSLSVRRGLKLFNLKGKPINYTLINKNGLDKIEMDKNGYDHFMLKEICQQPQVCRQSYQGRIDFKEKKVVLGGLFNYNSQIKQSRFIGFVGCGSSYHAGLLAEIIGRELGLSTFSLDSSNFGRADVDKYVLNNSSLFYLSQSGETSDTLNALKIIKLETQALNLGIVNVVGSSLARQVKAGVYTRAGIEVGVAATKSFLTQVLIGLITAIYIADLKGMKIKSRQRLFQDLKQLPNNIEKVVGLSKEIKQLAKRILSVDKFMFLGRRLAYPIALEGSLKLKEISYKFSYGDKLGSLKHGPLAIIDKDNLVIAIVFKHDTDLSKNISNIHEITARKGRVIVMGDVNQSSLPRSIEDFIKLPSLSTAWLTPMVAAVGVQLLAYYLALLLGKEIDRPRYLAKSVTVN